LEQVSDVPISIDTRHSQVAREAIKAGADIVNDVSGGSFDPLMMKTVASLNVPYIIMHMRGTPETMQNLTKYDNVVRDVSEDLVKQSMKAEEAGIPKWLQILDPGIGFAKDFKQNLALLKYCNEIRELVDYYPLLLGPSRKGFIGKITGETNAKERDYGTVATCILGSIGKNRTLTPTILRVHNVRGVKQATMVMDAVLDAKWL
jgi:dihydropteroate synthase